jgi:hypothetical protein
MIGLLIALVFSACCCDAGIDVGASEGDEMPTKAGLGGKEDLIADLPIGLLDDAKLFLLPVFSGAAEPRFWTGGGRAELSFTN